MFDFRRTAEGFPHGPTQAEWDAPEERAEVVAELPGRTALLLESEELIARLEGMLETVQARAEEEARLRAEEARLRA